MKRFIALLMCSVCVLLCFAGCKNTKGNAATPSPDNTAANTATATATASPSASSDASAATTVVPGTEVPASAGAAATPVPTPTPTPRPAQTNSIVPYELLTVGYTTPLPPATVEFPANYSMPYYIEVDVTNQCVNIFTKNTSTGAYDILLNRFVCSGGTSTMPTKLGHFYIKSQEQQKASTGQNVKEKRYYFSKYTSYAYYVTRYYNAYMFHSFTFEKKNGVLVPKVSAYNNMGNTGSAGCLRMLMAHAKWIYENIDAGTYCVVNKNRPANSALRKALKKYVPPLGWDMTAAWDGDKTTSKNLVLADNIPASYVTNLKSPDDITVISPTESPTPTPTPVPTPTPTPIPTPTATVSPTPTATPPQATDNRDEATPEAGTGGNT